MFRGVRGERGKGVCGGHPWRRGPATPLYLFLSGLGLCPPPRAGLPSAKPSAASSLFCRVCLRSGSFGGLFNRSSGQCAFTSAQSDRNAWG